MKALAYIATAACVAIGALFFIGLASNETTGNQIERLCKERYRTESDRLDCSINTTVRVIKDREQAKADDIFNRVR